MNKFLLFLKTVFIALILFSFATLELKAQISGTVSSVKIGDAKEGSDLLVVVDLYSSSSVSNITIAYQTYSQSEFKIRDMELQGTSASYNIPAEDIKLPYLTYYFIISFSDGTQETYPLGIPGEAEPLQLTVTAPSPKDKEVIILSPAKGELVDVADFFISISLIKAGDDVDVRATKIYLNDKDISDMALFAGDLILFYSDNFPGEIDKGYKSLKVDTYDKNGNLYHSVSSDFQSADANYIRDVASQFKSNLLLEGESRNEQFNDESTWYNNISADYNGSYDDWKFKGYAYLTSEEKSYLQPQNRFSASVENNWFNLRVGDSYPRYPELIMDGKRLRGFSGSINLGFFNIQTSYGEVVRNVEGSLIQTYKEDEVPLGSNIIAIDQAKYGNPYGEVNLGTFSRNLLAIRPSFGSGENFQFGLTYLHAKDDNSSVEFGARPEENLVIGTDLKVALDDQNILLTGQAAVSIYNTDISTGTLSDSEIDSVFGSDSYFDADTEQIKDIKNIIGKFITVNQFLGPLNPQEFSSLAGEAAIQLSYFYNNFKASYVYRGNDYKSFGQDFIRKDVKGINISDRVRLIDNKLFITLGYERLTDNLQETKIATTTYQKLNSTVSIFPRSNFPNITLGYTRYQNENGISKTDTVNNIYQIDDATNRFLIRLSHDLEIKGISNNLSLSLSTSSREDNSLSNNDANYTSTNLSVNSYWQKNLSSFVSLVSYSSEIAKVEYNYTSISLGARYRMLDNKLELSGSISPSFGDFKRQSVDFVAQYQVMQNFSLVFQFRLYRIPDQSTNSITGLSTRITL
ncbi:MAG: hypothetical protein KJ571_17770 [Bacteroidetes bacterium]|nr:hypothetical protein [Bacteroidota bacterium]